MRQNLISLEVRSNFRSTTYFVTRAQEAPVSWLELGRKCCHFFGVVQTHFSELPVMSLIIDKNMIISSKYFRLSPFM